MRFVKITRRLSLSDAGAFERYRETRANARDYLSIIGPFVRRRSDSYRRPTFGPTAFPVAPQPSHLSSARANTTGGTKLHTACSRRRPPSARNTHRGSCLAEEPHAAEYTLDASTSYAA